MSDMQSLINRIDEIEIHLAHQDHVIDELNSVIARQWNEIEAMARRLAKLGDRVQVAEEHGNAPAPVEPPPPHY